MDVGSGAHVFCCQDEVAGKRWEVTAAMADQAHRISGLVADVLAGADPALSLYDTEITGTGGTATLRVLVDREGGVDLDALTDATRALEAAFAEDVDLRSRYALEVSSPGLERPLRTPGHFRAAVGSAVSVKTFAPLDGTRRFDGTLAGADDDGCTLETEGTTRHLAYDAIAKAQTTFEWESGDKQKAARS